jgi:hypothetical protein
VFLKTVVDDDACNRAYGGTAANPEVYPSMLCAGDTSNGKRNTFLTKNTYCFAKGYLGHMFELF